VFIRVHPWLKLPAFLPSANMPKLLHLVVACAENRVIGRGGRLPWRIPEDVDHFHALTAGQTVVMGRVCYESWPKARADGRHPIVITSHPALAQPGIEVAASVDEALALAETLPGEIMICGGARIYAETLALSRPMHLHLTLVHASPDGDTLFPEWKNYPWRELSRRESADKNFRYTFLKLEK
jgi:dihydrofolate reductase